MIGGEGDKFTPVWLSQRMAEFIPQAEYVYVPGGTHTAPLERPDWSMPRSSAFSSSELALLGPKVDVSAADAPKMLIPRTN